MKLFKDRQVYKITKQIKELFYNENTLFIKKTPLSSNNTAEKYIKQKLLERQTELNKYR